MKYAIAGEKGGSGKTTLSTQLAISMARYGQEVLLVDADPQASATDVIGARSLDEVQPEVCCVGLQAKGLADEVRKLSKRYRDIVIDVGGRDSMALRSALVVADKVIIPLLPSQIDAWTLEKMDFLVGQAKVLNENLRAFVVLNRVDSNPSMTLASSVATFAREFPNLGLLESRLVDRVAHRRAVSRGRSVAECLPPQDKAVIELNRFVEEVLHV